MDSTFFGLTLEYKKSLIELIYYMVKHMRFSYSDVLRMPIWERSIYLDLWQKEMEEQQKQYKKAQSKGKSR